MEEKRKNNRIVSRMPVLLSMPVKRRVAAYARVSMEKEAMLHSLAAQVCYYSDLIRKNSEWEYAGVYADEGLTGTKENRPQFQRLLTDCRAGKIDMVLVKSISRFARNTVTLLETVRELKALGIDVYFEEQLTSYEAQVDYYTRYIHAKEETDSWEFVQVYTDEGISATNTKHREGFNAMVRDALAGKIDLIITKSVSRFARNTVDSLTTVRKLKERGVEVYFEKENIYTLDSKGKLLITIMSSLAQEESRSISENVTWGMRKRFADGKVSMPYKRFMGYRKGADGLPEIVEEEAEVVRAIYKRFLEGDTICMIAKKLNEKGIPSPAEKKKLTAACDEQEKKTKWCAGTVESILTNEKYKGDALLQKTYCTDFLTKKMKVNEGEVPQYYVQDSHPAIVDEDVLIKESVSYRWMNAGMKHFLCCQRRWYFS